MASMPAIPRDKYRSFRHISKKNSIEFYAAGLSISLKYSMGRVCASLNFKMGFKVQEHWVNLQDPAARQSNLFCLEIDHFRDTATGSVNLGQHFNQNC